MKRGRVPYRVRSNLRSSHRSVGTDDILVPDRVLKMKNPEQSLLTCAKLNYSEWLPILQLCIKVHSQALQVVSPRKYWELLHHTGPTQHPETHGGINKNATTVVNFTSKHNSLWSKHNSHCWTVRKVIFHINLVTDNSREILSAILKCLFPSVTFSLLVKPFKPTSTCVTSHRYLSATMTNSGTYRECRSDRFWKAEAPTKVRGLS